MYHELDLITKHKLSSQKLNILKSASLLRRLHRGNFLTAAKIGADKKVVCVADTVDGKVVITDHDIEHEGTEQVKLAYEDIMDELVQEM